jgi:hypothetical protein
MELISEKWGMQNDQRDSRTNFIYRMNSLDECLIEIERTGVDKTYALHRWYNYMTSVICENIFCEYGAVHESNVYNHDVDIYVDSVPYDVKLTVYPARLKRGMYDLDTRRGKDDIIRWYYANQSQQSRKQMVNRIYVVCDGPTPYECMVLKSNFDLMRVKIAAFMRDIRVNGLNEIDIIDSGKVFRLKSDIVRIT